MGVLSLILLSAGVFMHGFSGIEVDDEARTLIGQGREMRDSKPRKEDIVQE